MKSEILNFRTSSGIKSIVGRDLITDKFVAIFELVKNSYDAQAPKVMVSFNNLEYLPKDDLLDLNTYESLYELTKNEPHLVIRDNGNGMTKDDIENKWLFLAYSEKKDKEGANNYGRNFVGSKGVGRFSCDTLGGRLILKSKTANEKVEHQLYVNWNQFEENQTLEFNQIDVQYRSIPVLSKDSYTELIVRDLRSSNWHLKEEQDKTKRALEKLKNPFKSDDGFNIYVGRDLNFKNLSNEDKIINNISNVIKGYTTTVEASVIGGYIDFTLYDRGDIIFKLTKKNNNILKNTPTIISIHYLNPTAKRFFTRNMGIQPINYGTIFVYKNGFRVMPYGDERVDLFGLNLRKTQGYSRYVATRELLGYIEIQDHNNNFKETSSRNNGFIQNVYFDTLEEFYMNDIHRILERYIHLIQWGENAYTEEEIYFDPEHTELGQFKNYLKSKNYTIEYFKEALEDEIEKKNPEKKLEKLIVETKDVETKKIVIEAKDRLQSLKEETKQKEQKLINKTKEIKHLKHQNKNLIVQRSQSSYSEQISHHFTSMSERLRFATQKLMPLLKNLPDVDFQKALKELNKIRKTQNELDMFRSLLLKTNHDMRSKQKVNWYTESLWFIGEKEGAKGALNLTCSMDNEKYVSNWNITSNILEFQMVLENLYQNTRDHNGSYMDIIFYETHLVISNDSDEIDPNDLDKMKELGYSTKENGTGIGFYQIDQFFKKNGFVLEIEQKNNLLSFIFRKKD